MSYTHPRRLCLSLSRQFLRRVSLPLIDFGIYGERQRAVYVFSEEGQDQLAETIACKLQMIDEEVLPVFTSLVFDLHSCCRPSESQTNLRGSRSGWGPF